MKIKQPIPANLHPVIAKTVSLCCETDHSYRAICERAGVGHNTFTHWLKRRTGSTIAVVDAVLGVLGYELAVVKIARKPNTQKGPSYTNSDRKNTTIQQALNAYDQKENG